MRKVRVALRYCGGCNPRYERTALVERLRTVADLELFQTGNNRDTYEAILLVCGCPARCVSQDDLPEKVPVFVSASMEDCDKASAFLEEILFQQTAMEAVS